MERPSRHSPLLLDEASKSFKSYHTMQGKQSGRGDSFAGFALTTSFTLVGLTARPPLQGKQSGSGDSFTGFAEDVIAMDATGKSSVRASRACLIILDLLGQIGRSR